MSNEFDGRIRLDDHPQAYLPGDRRRALASRMSMADRVSGAALFADVSGFTALTEALAIELGAQRGAEELTATLNTVFHAVIADIDRYGGQVIYFSGDAITCWLDGDDGIRAVAAGLDIQRTMDTVGRVTTPAGTEVILAIKVAIAVGPARRFVVGDPKIQLIDVLAGSIVDKLAETEQLAEKGDVLLTDSVVASLGPRVTTSEEVRKGQRVVRAEALTVDVAEIDPGPEPVLPEAELRPWLLPVVYERLVTGRGEFLAELRSAFPMFVRFAGIDYDDDPEAPAALDAFVRRSQEVLTRHGGNLLQLTLGDKGAYLFAVFGSPVAHGDDADRALAAALELRAAAEMAARDLQIGVTSGRVRSGTYGHDLRRTFTCLGDPVNLSARLMSLAPSGAIYASDAVRRAATERFRWEEIGTFPVKGRLANVQVWALDGHSVTAVNRDLRFPLPIVGRDAELDAIDRAFAEAVSGRGRVIALSADAGQGKFRLIAEAVRRFRAGGAFVAFGEVAVIDANSSYAVWREVWRSLLAVDDLASGDKQVRAVRRFLVGIGPDQARRAALLAPVLGIDIAENALTRRFDAKLRKTSLEALLTDVLIAQAQRGAFVIVLEDCHRLDPLSRDLLEVLVRAGAKHPVLFLVGYRPVGAPGGGLGLNALPYVTELELGELPTAAAESLAAAKLRQLYGEEVSGAHALIDLVVRRAEGNPFYIEELLNFVHGTGIDPSRPEQLGPLSLPGSLHSLVLSRIDGLAEAPRRTLKVASVLGRGFTGPMVERVYPDLGSDQEVRANLLAGRRAELVVIDREEDASWLFRHAITRDVAYESLPFALRSQLHARCGAEIEADGADAIEADLDLLAYHWWQSDNRDKKIQYLGRAGDAAQAKYANQAAIDYFERLAGLVEGGARSDALRRAGKVLELVGNWERAREVNEEALELARTAADRSGEARCEVALAEVSRKQGRFDEAAERLERAGVTFTELREDSGTGQVLHLTGTLAAQQGRYGSARTNYSASLEVRERIGDRAAAAAVLSNLGVVAEYSGELDESQRFHERALALRTEIGDRWGIAVSHTNLGMIAILGGRPADARRSFEESMRISVEVGDTWMVAISHNNLGNACRGLGDWNGARSAYAAAAQAYLPHDDRWALAFLFEDVAVLAAVLAQPIAALELLGAADRCRADVGSPRPDSLTAEMMAPIDDSCEAAGLEEAARSEARDRGYGWDLDRSGVAVFRVCERTDPGWQR